MSTASATTPTTTPMATVKRTLRPKAGKSNTGVAGTEAKASTSNAVVVGAETKAGKPSDSAGTSDHWRPIGTGHDDDPFYDRYKRHTARVEYLQRNGVMTRFLNAGRIAKQCHCDVHRMLSFVQKRLGLGKFDVQDNTMTATVAGRVLPIKLEEALDAFADTVLMCRTCKQPELDEKQERCNGCGASVSSSSAKKKNKQKSNSKGASAMVPSDIAVPTSTTDTPSDGLAPADFKLEKELARWITRLYDIRDACTQLDQPDQAARKTLADHWVDRCWACTTRVDWEQNVLPKLKLALNLN